jgi:hypothetical protein
VSTWKWRVIGRWLAWAALAVAALPATWAQAEGVDPEADRLLRRMGEYLAGLEQFSVDTRNSLDAVLPSGQKVQFLMNATATVQRPDKLRAERKGESIEQVFVYDGKTLTLYNPADKVYATVEAPPTLEGTMDFAREKLDIIAPAGDFLYRDVYERFMQVTTSGIVVGKAIVGGVSCDQLAFRGPEVDWQVWIADGEHPVPLRYIVTTRDVTSYPEFTAVMHWNGSPQIGADTFRFVAPQGARQIDFLPLGTDAPAVR